MPFDNAYTETMGTEGGYVNDPTDRGGETYKGISRKFWPAWNGWAIIDGYKPINDKNILYKDKELDVLTREFYKINFWDVNNLDDVDAISPMLAEKIFDTGVNVGTGTVAKWFQSSLNLLNRNQKNYPDIKVDGRIGPNTIKTLQEAIKSNPIDRILTVFIIHQGEHYKKLMISDPSQERFIGWYDRVSYK